MRRVERLIAILGGLSRLSAIRLFSPRSVTILMYHGIPRRVARPDALDASRFEEHLHFLAKHFTFVSHEGNADRRLRFDRPRVALMFDDGFRNNAEVVAPILRAHQVPASFFVCSRHSAPGKYLWFSYLSALLGHFPKNEFTFRGRQLDMGAGREHTIKRLTHELLALTPHPTEMYKVIEEELPRLEDFISPAELSDNYAGMTAEQIAELSADPLFTVGAHTVDHPFLTRCSDLELKYQIGEDKRRLEEITKKPCQNIAYPCSDYNQTVLDCCRSAGFTHGYSVNPQLKLYPEFEIRRIGVYSPSLSALALKAVWGNLLPRQPIAWFRSAHNDTQFSPEDRPANATVQTFSYLS